MDNDFLNEIYNDINTLNKVIQNELVKEQNAGIVNVSLNGSDDVTDFLKDLSNNNDNKIIQLEQRKALRRQLECTKLQKKVVKNILK